MMKIKKLFIITLMLCVNLLIKNADGAAAGLAGEAISMGAKMLTTTQFLKVSFCIGMIESVEDFPKARNPSYKVGVNLGELGTKYSLAQLPFNYPEKEVLRDKLVLTVTNLGERRIAGFKSQILITGFPDDEHHVHLVNFRGLPVELGHGLFGGHSAFLEEIPYEDFTAAHVAACTITSARPLETDKSSFYIDLDAGSAFGSRIAILPDSSEAFVESIIGTQTAALVNYRPECVDERGYNALLLTFKTIFREIPVFAVLGVDSPVGNGVKLF